MDVGQPVPDVSFLAENGSALPLKALLGKKVVVLFFYPKDHSAGCTVEACSFRDAYEDFVSAGAEVIGVSTDDQASHEAFKERHRLPYRLLTDVDGQAAKALGIKKTLGLIKGRVTFVIDQQGVIRHRFDSQVRVNDHVTEALEVLKSLVTKDSAA